jgi:uncharacterized protein (TIGR04141 family)
VTLYRLHPPASNRSNVDFGEFVSPDIRGKRIETLGKSDIATLALWRGESDPGPPPWTRIVVDAFPDQKFEKPGPRDNALVIARVEVDGDFAYWAIAFGSASRHWIDGSRIDTPAHLEAAIEVQRDATTGLISGLTRVVALDITREAQRITREMRLESPLAAFQFEYDVQAMRGAKAKPTGDRLGKTLAAGESIRLTSIRNMDAALNAVIVLERAVRAGRRRGKAAVPGVVEVPLGKRTAELDNILIRQIKDKKNSSVILRLPDEAEGHSLVLEDRGLVQGTEVYDMSSLRKNLEDSDKLRILTIDVVSSLHVIDSEDDGVRFPVHGNLTTIVHKRGHLYILDSQKWYEAPAGWLQAVNARVDNCLRLVDYPEFDPLTMNDENAWNKSLAQKLPFAISLDKRLTRTPEFGRSGIEMLDVMEATTNGGNTVLRFVAAKRGLLSQDLSHLFIQVRTALDSLHQDDIRAAFLNIVLAAKPSATVVSTAQDVLGNTFYDPSRIEAVLAVIGDWKGREPSQAIPVLGRAGLQQTIARARMLGHEVYIAPVQTTALKPKHPRKRRQVKVV